MDSMSIEEFRNTIEAAVVTRSTSYASTYSVTIRWEADDTNAERDASFFKDIIRVALELPEAIEIVIPRNCPGPASWLQHQCVGVQVAANTAPGRSLVMFHYVGHGTQDEAGNLQFVEHGRGGAAQIDAEERVFRNVCAEDVNCTTDFLFILDCCYAHLACRATRTAPRIVEFIAATDKATPFAGSPPSNIITGKIYRAIMQRKNQRQRYIEFAEVMEYLRSEAIANHQKVPTHFLMEGAASICIPFQGPSFTADPTQPRPSHFAKFRAKIDNELTKAEQQQFVQWLQNRPPSVPLELLEFYPSGSQSLVLKGAWRTWSRLAGMKGWRLFDDLPVPHSQGPKNTKENQSPSSSGKGTQPAHKPQPSK
ncbi:hypothetical protein BDW74DRAFT_182202 [Aspergillus multicolor]|uniref:uncharacterized protein n=1 Tax=Aspergillus multicolor TaxID=41759 RepID=UPI003CCCA969